MANISLFQIYLIYGQFVTTFESWSKSKNAIYAAYYMLNNMGL